jgi:hypothetical protein
MCVAVINMFCLFATLDDGSIFAQSVVPLCSKLNRTAGRHAQGGGHEKQLFLMPTQKLVAITDGNKREKGAVSDREKSHKGCRELKKCPYYDK